MKIASIVSATMTAALALTAVPSGSYAQTAPATSAIPGAMAGDRTMTCVDIATERASIQEVVAAAAGKKQAAAKSKKRLFGFAKTFASLAIPGAAIGLGGSSMLGSIAAQSAGQTASQAVSSTGGATPSVQVGPTAAQQARLDRLQAIGAFRQCAA